MPANRTAANFAIDVVWIVATWVVANLVIKGAKMLKNKIRKPKLALVA